MYQCVSAHHLKLGGANGSLNMNYYALIGERGWKSHRAGMANGVLPGVLLYSIGSKRLSLGLVRERGMID